MSLSKNPFQKFGPYSKKYAGVSAIARNKFHDGVRFDLSLCVGEAFFDIKLPNVTLPSSYHPWLAKADYSFYSYRYDIEWKDKVFADVSYTALSNNEILIRTEITNNTDKTKNCVLNYFSSIEYPQDYYTILHTPKKSDVINAVNYEEYEYSIKRPWDEQNADGRKKGEFFDKRFTNEKGLGDRAEKWHMPHRVLKPFGGEKGDKVKFKIEVKNNYEKALLAVRYRTSGILYERGKQVGVHYIPGEEKAVFNISGIGKIIFEPCDDPKIKFIEIGKLEKGEFDLSLSSLGEGAAEFDFFAIIEEKDKDQLFTERKKVNFVPQYENIKEKEGFKTILKYEDIKDEYILRIFSDNTRFREIHSGSLEDCMSARLSNGDETFDDLTESFTGAFSRKHSDDGFFHNAITHTIFIDPKSSNIQYAILSENECEYLTKEEYEKIYQKNKTEAIDFICNSKGERYKLSNQILAATVMTNVVYPIYKHGDFIIHHTPGKRWDCLYTWDSGFIGLGMNELSPKCAEYIIDTYLTDESNPDYAFLHHGSPVPVQIYQLFEMLQKQNDKNELLKLYPKVRLYYEFLAGKIRGSTTGKFKSGLLTTYDYFYSSSGMDDYPAQMFMKADELRDKAAPIISTSQVIRFGKILSILADRLCRFEDVKEYESDIERLTEALNKYSWNEESGYYSYVIHGENYEPLRKYLSKTGEDLNKGLDGIYPIIAGVCSTEQKERILSHIKNQNEMLSPFGISAVDKSAGYFKVNGYWNGNVWFPHQWFIWKSMLDLGEMTFAKTIADLALEIWKREVEEKYYTFEMVNVVTGCGGWFHNFGGLSTPINLWYKAYYCPGTINVGFDSFIESYTFNEKKTELKMKLSYYGKEHRFGVIAVMNEGSAYKVFINGKSVSFENDSGCVSFSVERNEEREFEIIIKEE